MQPSTLIAEIMPLLHSASGQALLSRMNKKDEPMDIQKELVSIMKDCGGPVALCKSIVDRGRSPCGEAELVAAISRFAADASGEAGDVSFARLYESEMVWKACKIAKENEFAVPQVISGGEWRDEDDREQAMKQLAEIGRQMAPTATPAKQFDLAFSDPKNAALAQRAHVRPTAPAGGAYAWRR